MLERPTHLPQFKDPPLEEVAVALHFEPITDLCQPHLGFFWAEVRGDYPKLEDHPPLPPLPSGAAIEPSFRFELLGAAPLNRSWFMADDDSHLIQVQRDRFVHNWRRRSAEYPHFESVLERFTKEFSTFASVLQTLDIEEPKVRAVEITYVNWISRTSLSDITPLVARANFTSADVDPHYKVAELRAVFAVRMPHANPASLSVECGPSSRLSKIGSPEIGCRFGLTFRADVRDISATREAMLLGRAAIVQSFFDLTNSELHQEWGIHR